MAADEGGVRCRSPQFSRGSSRSTRRSGRDAFVAHRLLGPGGAVGALPVRARPRRRRTTPVPFEQIVGQPVTVTLAPRPAPRAGSTASSRASAPGQRDATEHALPRRGRPAALAADAHDRLARLPAARVPDIVRRCSPTRGAGDVRARAAATPARDYCVQYRETRLRLRQPPDGGGGHLLLLPARRRRPHARPRRRRAGASGRGRVPASTASGAVGAAARARVGEDAGAARRARSPLRDYDFELPHDAARGDRDDPGRVQAGQVTHRCGSPATRARAVRLSGRVRASASTASTPAAETGRATCRSSSRRRRRPRHPHARRRPRRASSSTARSTVPALASGRTFALAGPLRRATAATCSRASSTRRRSPRAAARAASSTRTRSRASRRRCRSGRRGRRRSPSWRDRRPRSSSARPARRSSPTSTGA